MHTEYLHIHDLIFVVRDGKIVNMYTFAAVARAVAVRT
jgi:hypothetical protein